MTTETIARQVRRAPNPYKAAIAKHEIRSQKDSPDHLDDKKVFHFEDGSFITFAVSYLPIEDGKS